MRKILPFIKTKDADINNTELKDLLEYAILNSGCLELEDIYIEDCYYEAIISDYHDMCSMLEKNYVIGKLDTFLRAACLMISCFSVGIFKQKAGVCETDCRIASARVGIEAAITWIQKPYRYLGKNSDEVDTMPICNFDATFIQNPSFIEDRKENFVNIFKYCLEEEVNPSPISLSENLYLIYYAGLLIQGDADFMIESFFAKQENDKVIKKNKSFFRKS